MASLDVIIVSFNTRELLLRCLASVERAQWNGLLNVLVVDNGSSDGSQAAGAAASFPRVRLIETGENLGFSRANNLALKRVEGGFRSTAQPGHRGRRKRIHGLGGVFGGSSRYRNGELQAGDRRRDTRSGLPEIVSHSMGRILPCRGPELPVPAKSAVRKIQLDLPG